MIDYEVISTGSQDGNCFRVENALFDIGVKFAQVKPQIENHNIKIIFISHRHGDHYNKSTYNQISSRYPFIKFVVNEDIEKTINRDYPSHADNLIVVKDNTNISIPSFNDKYHSLNINVFHTDHDTDVQTNGYYGEKVGESLNDENFVYATDFHNINNLPDKKLDYIFLEANYDEETLKKVVDKFEIPVWSLKGSYRHLSKEESYKYYIQHRKENTVYIQLHKSSRFYDEFDESNFNYQKRKKETKNNSLGAIDEITIDATENVEDTIDMVEPNFCENFDGIVEDNVDMVEPEFCENYDDVVEYNIDMVESDFLNSTNQ